jgi:acetyl-CoA carboxylase carboxyl transferase subunit beta
MPIFDKYIKIPKKEKIPDGLWIKCIDCGEMIYSKQLEENMKVCPKCNYHFRLTAKERINLLIDEGTWQECIDSLTSKNPLNFPEYEEKLKKSMEKTSLTEAVVIGIGKINGIEIAFGVTDFNFMGASMGSVFGEKVTRLIELAIERMLPLVIVTSSGGARMQEGVLSLMQLAKTSAALSKLHEKKLFYLSVLTDPTTGGVTASFAMLGDIIIAEPKALIGFAGPRVIEQTIKQKLPIGFQHAEFLLEHGMIDMIVHRKELKSTISKLLNFFTK